MSSVVFSRAPMSGTRIQALLGALAVVLASLCVGLLIGVSATVVAAVVLILAFLLVAIVHPPATPLGIFLVPLAVGFVSGLGGLIALVLCVGIFARRRGALLHPLTLIGLPLGLYLIIGAANVSTYRGTITDATVIFILGHVLVLLAGVVVVGGFGGTRLRSIDPRTLSVPLEWRVASVVPGLLGISLAVHKAGLVILHPGNRAEISGLALLLSESLEAAAVLQACHMFSQPRIRAADVAFLAAILVGLSMDGYRGWPLIGVILIALCGVFTGRIRFSARGLLLLALATVLIIAGGEYIRRDTAGGRSISTQLTTQQEAAKYNARGIPPGLLELHFAFRETVGLSQVLITDRHEGYRPTHSLLLGDLLTILPGKQVSGLVALDQLPGLAISGQLGLTAGAVGVSYMDIGNWSWALFAAVGLVIGFAWRLAARDMRWRLLYLFVLVYVVQWFHRGIPKASYVIVPAFFLFLTWVAHFRGQLNE